MAQRSEDVMALPDFDLILSHAQINLAIGHAIARRRVELGMTMSEVSFRWGHFGHIGRIERGEDGIGVVGLLRLSKVLRTSPAELLNDAFIPVYRITADPPIEKEQKI